MSEPTFKAAFDRVRAWCAAHPDFELRIGPAESVMAWAEELPQARAPQPGAVGASLMISQAELALDRSAFEQALDEKLARMREAWLVVYDVQRSRDNLVEIAPNTFVPTNHPLATEKEQA